MNELQQIEKQLAAAEKSLAETAAAHRAVVAELERFDTSQGDLDAAVDEQIRLTAKRDILEKRLEIAGQTVEKLRGDLLISRADAAAAAAKSIENKLEAAREKARQELLKILIQPTGDDIYSAGELQFNRVLEGAIGFHKSVVPLKIEFKQAQLRTTDAANRATSVRRDRHKVEHDARMKIQGQVFAGQIGGEK